MIRRPRRCPKPRLAAGQCPVCEWWFDGHKVGAGDPTGDTGPIVEWSVDARDTGRCLKHECFVINKFQAPRLETPLARRRQAADA